MLANLVFLVLETPALSFNFLFFFIGLFWAKCSLAPLLLLDSTSLFEHLRFLFFLILEILLSSFIESVVASHLTRLVEEPEDVEIEGFERESPDGTVGKRNVSEDAEEESEDAEDRERDVPEDMSEGREDSEDTVGVRGTLDK